MRGHTLGAFIKLTVFAVVTILATAVLAVTISNTTYGGNPKTFKADFTDATDLLPGDSVRIAGVRVGTVKSVSVVHQHFARVTFNVDGDIPVLTSTKFAIRYLNLVGQRYVAVVEQAGGDEKQNPKQIIGTDRTQPALDLTVLFRGFRPLFHALSPDEVNSFAMEIIKTLQGEGGVVADLAAKSATLTNTVADRDAVIGGVVNNLLTVLDTVAKRNQGLNQTVEQLQRLVTGLASDRNTIAASLQNIDNLASNSALLLQGIRPYLPSDITSLSKIARTLNTTRNCSGYVYPVNNEPAKTAVPKFAKNCATGPNTLEEYLKRAPTKLIQIIRTATYGSFFNFYLCDLASTGALGVATIPINSAACGS
ncbi:MAG: phospholipid/cholesterol/gamma-HCH transport system substrate-binding protein [Frankiaceae bacterium]|jgi:phospholipid/cholesterol/gamma-HCH transport system substrate-binding protein|nr:phospholipid/cholesterol/gamma-HCH transport system substrate-binding protein [Frankiaceae bacterium]MDQ1699779.1 phospholipid/cholesterol/gamma-HCH transport system substrate-binding protein [Frankiaceae bacterium]